jgi:hypothetical protein
MAESVTQSRHALPRRLEGSFAGVGLRCMWCNEAPQGGGGRRTDDYGEREPNGTLSLWEFADGTFLLCYMCAARIVAYCLGADPAVVGIWTDADAPPQ